MTIGLVLLAITAILIFFGVSERFFRSLGLSNWLAFLLVLALVVGAIVPAISIAGVFSLNLGGFAVPLVIMTVLIVIMRSKSEVGRSILAMIAVAAVATSARMLIEPVSGGLILASSLIVGLVGGMAAFLVGQSRLATLASCMGGIILGDIITNFLYRFVVGGYEFSLGSYGVFDSIVIASVFGIMLCEAVRAIKKTAGRRTRKARTVIGGAAVMAESGEDELFEAETVTISTGDEDTQLELSNLQVHTLDPADPVGDGKNFGDENFFDDFI